MLPERKGRETGRQTDTERGWEITFFLGNCIESELLACCKSLRTADIPLRGCKLSVNFIFTIWFTFHLGFVSVGNCIHSLKKVDNEKDNNHLSEGFLYAFLFVFGSQVY